MGKHYTSNIHKPPPKKREIHPIWCGIGFVMIIFIPIIAYYGTLFFIDENKRQGWFYYPTALAAPGSDSLLFIKVIITLILTFILYSIFTFIIFLLYSLFGPPRYGPTDVPPTQYRGKRYTR